MSELISVSDRIYTKLEMNNPGGSHKYRAARQIVEHAVRRGDIIPGVTTVIEKTGGSFGFGATTAAALACWFAAEALPLAASLGTVCGTTGAGGGGAASWC